MCLEKWGTSPSFYVFIKSSHRLITVSTETSLTKVLWQQLSPLNWHHWWGPPRKVLNTNWLIEGFVVRIVCWALGWKLVCEGRFLEKFKFTVTFGESGLKNRTNWWKFGKLQSRLKKATFSRHIFDFSTLGRSAHMKRFPHVQPLFNCRIGKPEFEKLDRYRLVLFSCSSGARKTAEHPANPVDKRSRAKA